VRRVKRSAEIAITAEGRQGGGVPPHFKEPCDAGFRTKTKALGRGQCEASQAERRSYDKAGRKAKRRRVRVNGGLRIPTDAPRSPRRGRGRPLLSWLVRKKQKQISQTVDRSQARRCPTLPSPGTWAAPSDCEADRPSTSLRTGRSPKRAAPAQSYRGTRAARTRRGAAAAHSYSERVRAMSRRRASARAKMEPSENLPSAERWPAGMPVRISMPSATVATG
jgi:hypothetical protein